MTQRLLTAALVAFMTALAGVLSLAGAAAAQGSAYSVYASQTDLADGGVLAGALPTCLAVISARSPTPTVLFFDEASGQIAEYDPDRPAGDRTRIRATTSALSAAAGVDTPVCRDGANETVDFTSTGAAFFVLTGRDGIDRVLRLDANGALTLLTDPASPVDTGDGTVGVAHTSTSDGTGLFLARSTDDGAPANGFYRLDPAAPAQHPQPVALDDRLDLVSLIAFVPDDLYGVSRDGEPPYRNVVVSTNGGGGLYAAERPCEGSPPLLPTCDGGLGDIALSFARLGRPGNYIYVPYVLVANETSTAPGGIAVAGIGPFNPAPDRIVFVADDLVAATGIAGFATPASGGYLDVVLVSPANLENFLLVAGSDAGGATPGIYAVNPFFATGAEPEATGNTLALTVSPNPARFSATVIVTVVEPSPIRVVVVDALGREVAVVLDGAAGTGETAVSVETGAWPAGVYVVRATVGAQTATARLVVAR
ncbi:MAG TPA: T9SS type A sorting domain-containing protein [Rubricoccaceae bacterium]|jgi:hypothetical protein